MQINLARKTVGKYMTNNCKKYLYGLFLVIFIALFLFSIKYKIYIQHTESMSPTIFPGTLCLIKKCKENLNRFDIVAYELNYSEGIGLGRIVGLPCERIKFLESKIIIDDRELDLKEYKNIYNEINRNYGIKYGKEEYYEIKKGEYFLIGDNHRISFDSRYHGGIDSCRIIGKVVFTW
ncbi:MAG: signal peptidase I [Methylacidiphilales bacterium]|nr:signal peptidase I [Candidatus Methylacidiphilales bacterium]